MAPICVRNGASYEAFSRLYEKRHSEIRAHAADCFFREQERQNEGRHHGMAHLTAEELEARFIARARGASPEHHKGSTLYGKRKGRRRKIA
jgi:hypothetical protein